MESLEPAVHIEQLNWDDWNREHIKKHAVSPEEVEEVLAGLPLVGRSKSKPDRIVVIGPTVAGRVLFIAMGPDPQEPGVWYPFSARPAHRVERRIYRETLQDG
jgi:uncharacterized DUF497 family protein